MLSLSQRMSRSDPDPGKNSEPSKSKMSLELRPTAPSDQGRLNEAFQVSRAERGPSSLLSSHLAS